MSWEDLVIFVFAFIITIFVFGYRAGNEQVQKQTYMHKQQQVINNQNLPLTYTYRF